VRRILLVGQDFAWKTGATHVAGHHAERTGHRPPSHRTLERRNLDGETIYSTLSYTTAVTDMEKDIRTRAKAGLEICNLYGGGLPIRGAREVTEHEARMEGMLVSTPGSREGFLWALEHARQPRPAPCFEPRAGRWGSSLRSVTKRLEKLFKKPAQNDRAIWKSLEEVHAFLRQDPLYLPYLYKEVMEVAGLVFRAEAYEPRDLVRFKQVVKRVNAKVRRMDAVLARNRKRMAA
jgi:hypothetical protein